METPSVKLLLIFALSILPLWLQAQDRSHARSMVITRYGIVATSYAQASLAGAQILAQGGSAIDAAIAAKRYPRGHGTHDERYRR